MLSPKRAGEQRHHKQTENEQRNMHVSLPSPYGVGHPSVVPLILSWHSERFGGHGLPSLKLFGPT
jgi:hypothetical protein